jgi:acyl-CoA-dependent ceramide synthase
MLNYLNFPLATDIAFGIFIVSWFITRHILYNFVCWSIHAHVPSERDMPYGCFNSTTGKQLSSEGGTAIWSNIVASFDNPGGEVCFNNRIRVSFLSLLMALQVLTLIWFGMIIRVAYRVLSGKNAADTRSDDEGDDEEEEEEEDELTEEEIEVYDSAGLVGNIANGQAQMFIVEEADGANVGLNGASKTKKVESAPTPVRRSSRRIAVTKASGISIPGHGDKKELLGRIGCDKPS